MTEAEGARAGLIRGAVVTGAAGDVGSAVAASFLADGFRVYGADIVPIAARPNLVTLTVDVTDRDAVLSLARRAANETALWAWVNAAGIVAMAPIEEADPETWQRIIAVNLTGCFHGCAAALAVLAAQDTERRLAASAGRAEAGGGRIVNVGSISGQLGGIGPHPAYGAAKAGVHALTKSYALAGARHGITCNAVAPSVLEGHMGETFSESQRAKLIRGHPMRRLGRIDEVVHAIRYLCDPRASFTNGAILQVNGGALMTG